MRRLREIEGYGERIPAIAVTGYAGAVDELNELAKAIARVSRKV